MEMEDQLTPTQIKIIAGWSHNYLGIIVELMMICFVWLDKII
jgi:hypothetical protein